MSQSIKAPPPSTDPLFRRAVLVGVLAFVPCAAWGLLDPAQFFRSYLLAWLFWLGIALGCLGILMLQHLSGGAWGVVIRRILESGTRTLPMMVPRRIVIVFQAENLLAPRRESEAAASALEHLLTLFDSPEPQTVLVFVAASLDKRTRMFKALTRVATVVDCGAPEDAAAAERWVRARVAAAGAEIDVAGARAMALLAGFPDRPRNDGKTGDVKRLRGEIDRLLLYSLGQKQDVREVAGPAALQDDWAMTNAIEAGQAGEALRQLALMLDAGAPPEKVLGQLGWVVRSKFPSIAIDGLEPAVDAVFRTDVDLKSSGGDARVLLERLVVELCAGKRARAMGSRRW